MPFQMPSLLDDQDSLLPSGLLSAFQAPTPNTPMAALQQLATQPAGAPSPVGGGGGPTPAPKPAPNVANVPLARTPEPMNPLKTGIVSGGLQLLQDSAGGGMGPAPSVGQMISRALAAGVPAFVASKQAKQTREIELQRQSQYQNMVKKLGDTGALTPEQVSLASGFSADQGMPYIQKLQEERNKITVVGKKAIRGDGQTVAEDTDPFKEVNGQLVGLDAGGNVAMGADGKPQILADLRTKPDVHMSDEQAGIARSLNLDPNAVAQWTPAQTSAFNKELFRQKSAVAPKTSIQLGQNAGEEAAMKGSVEGVVTRGNAIRDNLSAFNTASEAKKLLSQGIITGTGADFRTKFGNALVSAGLGDPSLKDTVARTQQFLGNTQELTTRLVKRLGSGNGITDKDVQFINGITGRDISQQPETLKYLLDLQQRAIRADATRHNDEVGSMQGISDAAKANLKVPVPDMGGDASGAPAAAAGSGTGTIGGKSVPLEQHNGQWYYISGNKAYPYTGGVRN